MTNERKIEILNEVLYLMREEIAEFDGICLVLEYVEKNHRESLQETYLEPNSDEYTQELDNIQEDFSNMYELLQNGFMEEEGYQCYEWQNWNEEHPERFHHIGPSAGGNLYHFPNQKARVEFLEKLIKEYKN